MAALTADQLTYLHDQLGTAADEVDAQARYDRLGDVRLVVLEVLERRMADLVADPASFSVAGEYSQNTSDNIRVLGAQIDRLRAGGEATGYPVVKMARAARPLFR